MIQTYLVNPVNSGIAGKLLAREWLERPNVPSNGDCVAASGLIYGLKGKERMKNLIRRYFETKIETRKSMARSQEIYAYVEVGKFAFKVGNTDLLDKSLERILELIEH